MWEGLSPYLSLGKIKAARLLGFSTKGQPSTLSSNPRLPHSTALVLILGIFPAVQLLPARRTPALFGLSSETVPPTTLATIKVDNKVQRIIKQGKQLYLDCPKNSKVRIFDPTRTFRIFRILDLEKSQGMKGLSDPIWTRTSNISNISDIFSFSYVVVHIFHAEKKEKKGRKK